MHTSVKATHMTQATRPLSGIAGCVLAAAVASVCLLFAPPAQAAHTHRVLYTFTGGADGGSPQRQLILDSAGNLYGVTPAGGASGNGAVFELVNTGGTWKETVLYSFTGGVDGGEPSGRLLLDSAGNLYGLADAGGTHAAGVAYKLTPNGSTWTEKVMFNFTGYPAPTGGLTMDSAGNLYGAALASGYQHCFHGCGVVFRLTLMPTKKWKYTILYKFLGHTKLDGEQPTGDLVVDAAGNIYGTTFIGGKFGETGGYHGYGTAFKLSLSGTVWVETVLHNFAGAAGSDGSYPGGSVVFDAAGNLYMSTTGGGILNSACTGPDGGCGTIVKLYPGTSGWTESVLYQFTGGNDGANPDSGLVIDASGNLYGTAPAGGSKAGGVVYELTPSAGTWTQSLWYSFLGNPDGQQPEGGVVRDARGNLFGNTSTGGTGSGVVYEITP